MNTGCFGGEWIFTRASNLLTSTEAPMRQSSGSIITVEIARPYVSVTIQIDVAAELERNAVFKGITIIARRITPAIQVCAIPFMTMQTLSGTGLWNSPVSMVISLISCSLWLLSEYTSLTRRMKAFESSVIGGGGGGMSLSSFADACSRKPDPVGSGICEEFPCRFSIVGRCGVARASFEANGIGGLSDPMVLRVAVVIRVLDG